MFRSDSPIYIFTQTHLILLTYGSRVAWWEALLFHSSRISGSTTNSGYCLCGDLHVLLVFGWVASHLSKNAGRWTGCVKLTLVVNVCVHSAVWWNGTHSGCIPALLLVFSGLALDLLGSTFYMLIWCYPLCPLQKHSYGDDVLKTMVSMLPLHWCGDQCSTSSMPHHLYILLDWEWWRKTVTSEQQYIIN